MPVFCLRFFVFHHLLFMTLQLKLNKVFVMNRLVRGCLSLVQNVEDYTRCVICDCRLNGDNRSDVVNVCKFCQHSLES